MDEQMERRVVKLSANQPEFPRYVKWAGVFGGVVILPCESIELANAAAESVRRNKFGEPVICGSRRIVAPMQAVQS